MMYFFFNLQLQLLNTFPGSSTACYFTYSPSVIICIRNILIKLGYRREQKYPASMGKHNRTLATDMLQIESVVSHNSVYSHSHCVTESE